MTTNNGKYLERMVLLIEKSIDPDARIEHNVQMPIIGSRNGSTTQCDIVIWTGTPPRETITLVEVQDRSSKVKPNDFRGWQQKLEDVGAQHLICVSRHEFPDSIKEKAMLAGNKIHLINIKDAHPSTIPLNLLKTKFRMLHFEVLELNCSQFSLLRNANSKDVSNRILHKRELQHTDECFSFDEYELTNLYKICRDGVNYHDNDLTGTKSVKFDFTDIKPLYYFYENQFIRISLHLVFRYERKIEYVPVNTLSYEQQGDTLAWVFESSYNSDEGVCAFRIPIRPVDDHFVINNLEVSLPSRFDMTMTINKTEK